MDREHLADIVYALRDVPGFDALYDLGSRAIVAVSDPAALIDIAARLTALPPMGVDIRFRPARSTPAVAVSAAELERARERHEARRSDWATYSLETDAVYPTRRGKSILIVSKEARAHADAIRMVAGAPLATYGTANVERVEELVRMYGLAPAFVLDEDLSGTKELALRLTGVVKWISSSRGLPPDDVDAILAASSIPSRRALGRERVFAGLRILVVDVHDGALDSEVHRAAPGARFERAIGWNALERLGQGDLDVVITGEMRDISLPTLARFVQRCETPPLLLIASARPTSSRMRTAYPKLAHYFIERPLCAEDLIRALRR